MDTYEVNRIAVGGFSKCVREALKRLGMRRCSVRLVRYQCEKNDLRADWYSLFWRWFLALWMANREGAEFLYEDFTARVAALRDADDVSATDYDRQLARCEGEHSDIIRARINGEDVTVLIQETIEAIVEKRRLVAMLVAHKASGLRSQGRKVA